MKTYEEILEGLLARIPDDLDKSEGDLIYITTAPVAAALAEQNVYIANIFDATMPDTACGEEQTRIYKSFGINRKLASPAIRKGVFTDTGGNPVVPALGWRFGADGLAYYVSKADGSDIRLTCETAGTAGNHYFGDILPLDPGVNLGSSKLTDVIEYGVEDEDDETFRARFFREVNTRVTGSNVAWYEQEILNISGVGGVKVFPTPDGQGGRVHCVITAPGNVSASHELIQKVQSIIDPNPHGSGSGRAPIDHYVTISTVNEVTLDVTGRLWLKQLHTPIPLSPAKP